MIGRSLNADLRKMKGTCFAFIFQCLLYHIIECTANVVVMSIKGFYILDKSM